MCLVGVVHCVWWVWFTVFADVCRAQDALQDQQKEFIHHSFTTPPFDEVKLEETPHGLALVLDQKDIAGSVCVRVRVFAPKLNCCLTTQ